MLTGEAKKDGGQDIPSQSGADAGRKMLTGGSVQQVDTSEHQPWPGRLARTTRCALGRSNADVSVKGR